MDSFAERGQGICKSCYKDKHNNNNNPERMWVNGKYVPKSHPLWKAGRYKSFDDAAFSGLVNYETSTEGMVYIITNPAWPKWVKIGKAEALAHTIAEKMTTDRRNEWFKLKPSQAKQVLAQVETELNGL